MTQTQTNFTKETCEEQHVEMYLHNLAFPTNYQQVCFRILTLSWHRRRVTCLEIKNTTTVVNIKEQYKYFPTCKQFLNLSLNLRLVLCIRVFQVHFSHSSILNSKIFYKSISKQALLLRSYIVALVRPIDFLATSYLQMSSKFWIFYSFSCFHSLNI